MQNILYVTVVGVEILADIPLLYIRDWGGKYVAVL